MNATKTVSRITALFMVLILMLTLIPISGMAAGKSDIIADGTYSETQNMKLYSYMYDVTVTVVVSDGKISSITATPSGSAASKDGYVLKNAVTSLNNTLSGQSATSDVVESAAYSSTGVPYPSWSSISNTAFNNIKVAAVAALADAPTGGGTDGVTYTASIPVKSSNIAQTKANNAATNSVELLTNDSAPLTYQYGDRDSKTSDYVEEPTIEVEKEFYLHHSSTGKTEMIKWSELKSDGSYNVTKKVPNDRFYGGLFITNEYKTPTAQPGTRLEPQGGATYFMREPNQDYLYTRNFYLRRGGKVIASYGIMTVDDNKYREVGFYYGSDKNDPSKGTKVYSAVPSDNDGRTSTLYEDVLFVNVNRNVPNVPSDFYTGKEELSKDAVLATGRLDNVANGYMQGYWITADNVLVKGNNIRELRNGLKVANPEDPSGDYLGNYSATEYTAEQSVSYQEIPVKTAFVGADDEDEPISTDFGVKLAGYTTSLNGNIAMNFYLELSEEVAADEDAYMQFTLPGANTTAKKVMLTDAVKQTRDGKTYYVFSAGVAAKEMTSDIKAQFVKGDGTKSPEWTYTIKEYCDYIRSHADEYDAESISLAENMLLYGGNAQKYFKYKLDKLADEGMDRALPEVDLGASFDPVVKGSCEGLTYAGSSAMLTTTTGLRHYFEFAENAGDYTFTANGKKLTVESDKNGKYVLIDNIKAKDLKKPITLKVTDKAGNEFVLTYSVYTNIKQVLNGNFEAIEKDLSKALYCFGEASLVYFNTH